MTANFESRRFRRSLTVGIALTLLACVADQLGFLSSLDDWFYDLRAARCQVFSPRPDGRIVHIDIDDPSQTSSSLGRWPWSRGKLARIVSEIGRAAPAAIGLDLHLDTTESPDSPTTEPGTSEDADQALTDSLAAQKNVVLAEDIRPQQLVVETSIQSAAAHVMIEDLELTRLEFLKGLRMHGVEFSDQEDLSDLYAHARAAAMQSRVRDLLVESPSMTDDQLIARLLPHVQIDVNLPAMRVLREQAVIVRGRQAFRRFGVDATSQSLPIVHGQFEKIPIQTLLRSAAYCGFVNYQLIPGSTVRSVPLMIESENKVYPQFGLVMACAVMGADISKARIERDWLVIPKPDGTEARIPTHNFHSSQLNRDFSCIADIPWFGNSNWLTMYDWPSHRRQQNHISVNVVWDICMTVDKIQKNNRTIDKAIQAVLGGDGHLRLDPEYAEDYAKMVLDPMDAASREKAIQVALDPINSFLAEDEKTPANDLLPEQREFMAQLKDSRQALIALEQGNAGLQSQLVKLRGDLHSKLSGKGVFLGWTVEGRVDKVTTSLVDNCPGVVVHGVIADAVLSGHWWRRAPDFVGLSLVLMLGFAAAVFVSRLPPLRGVIATLLMIAGYLLINGFVFFDFAKWIVPVAGPVVTISIVWSGCTLNRVVFEGFERNRIATEVALISREMELAHKVQAALIPRFAPEIAGIEAEGWTQPADTTGGDCYDLWALPDGRLAILLADASGHGLAPAMIVSQVRTLVRALSEIVKDPGDLLKRVNARVADDLEAGRFVTVFLGFLSPNGELEFASAGHGPQFWFTCDDGELQEFGSTGAPIGCDNEWLCDEPGPPIQLGEGCTLVIMSDGIFEAMDPVGQQYGLDRLKDLLHKYRGKPGRIIIEQITAAMHQWQQNRPPKDDQTVVIARRLAMAKEAKVAADAAA